MIYSSLFLIPSTGTAVCLSFTSHLIDFKYGPHKKIKIKNPKHQSPSAWGMERAQLLQNFQKTHQHRDLTTVHIGWFLGLIILS